MSGADRKVLKGMWFEHTKVDRLEEWPAGWRRFLHVVGFQNSEHWGRRAKCEVHYLEPASGAVKSGKPTCVSPERLSKPTFFTQLTDPHEQARAADRERRALGKEPSATSDL